MSTVDILSEPGLLLPDLCLLLPCVDCDDVSSGLKENKGIFIVSKSRMCEEEDWASLHFNHQL